MTTQRSILIASCWAVFITFSLVPSSRCQAQDSAGAPPIATTAGAPSDAVAGAAAAMAPVSIAAAAEQAGFTAQQLGDLKSKTQSGGLNPDEMQRLCDAVAIKGIGAADVESTARAMGLSGEQTEQLKTCVASHGTSATATNTQPASGARPRATESSPSVSETVQLSSIERAFSALAKPGQTVLAPSPLNLRQFGYSMFSSKVSTFAPVDEVPVSGDYVLGPGDELIVMMWGRLNRTLHVKVQRDGTALVPEMGPVQVAGLTFEQAKKLIEGRESQTTGVSVDVTMGQIRTIQVFVIGKVNHPGLYTISALSHVSNALVAAGGISQIGTLRRVELRRDGQTIRNIDLYDMLLHGNTGADVQLESRDVIFVPVIGPVVGIAGDVKQPAIYELRGNENLGRALAMAGGVSAFGYEERLQVERIQGHARRVVLDVAPRKLDSSRFDVEDGDLIKVFTVLSQQQNAVTLKGNVLRPGTYQWYEGMTVADLVREGEGVADHTFFDYALIRRVVGPERKIHYVPVNLGHAIYDHKSANVALEPRDEVRIYSEDDLADIPKVLVNGAVRKPGKYPLSEGMKVSDLIYEAGGLKRNAYQEQAQLGRVSVADGSKAVFTFEDIDLRAIMNGSLVANAVLEPGDELFVQEASNWHTPWQVILAGEVVRPGPYLIRQGEPLDSVLTRAGGPRDGSYLPAIVFVRHSVKKSEQKQLNESRQRLQQEIARVSMMPPRPGETDANRTGNLAMMRQVLDESERQQAVGRVVLQISSLKSLPKSQADLVLENGDSITIPKKPATVNVLGQVYSPVAIVYASGRTVGDYLQMAGGPTEGADTEHMFVIRADGSTITDAGIRSSGDAALFPLLPSISRGLMGVRLGPGDTVYVPPKLIYVDRLKETLDITQIVANAAMSLAVVGLLGSQL